MLVSTVFLALDHSHGQGGAPLLFETMTFAHGRHGVRKGIRGQYDGERYRTWEEALAGHERALKRAKHRTRPFEFTSYPRTRRHLRGAWRLAGAAKGRKRSVRQWRGRSFVVRA